jgi:hypothetical protein
LKKLVLSGLLNFLVVSVALAQSGINGAVGTIGPSGTPRPLPTAAPATSGTTVTGTFTLALTVSVLPGIPASTPIQCTLQASVTGFNTATPPAVVDSISDSSVVTAKRSGSTATCSVVLPYQWTLFGTGDTVVLAYLVNARTSTGVGRVISVFIDTIPVPPSGTTTKETQTGAV